jgi:hypothetical protein
MNGAENCHLERLQPPEICISVHSEERSNEFQQPSQEGDRIVAHGVSRGFCVRDVKSPFRGDRTPPRRHRISLQQQATSFCKRCHPERGPALRAESKGNASKKGCHPLWPQKHPYFPRELSSRVALAARNLLFLRGAQRRNLAQNHQLLRLWNRRYPFLKHRQTQKETVLGNHEPL